MSHTTRNLFHFLLLFMSSDDFHDKVSAWDHHVFFFQLTFSTLAYNCFTACVRFCRTMQRVSHRHAHIPPSWRSLPPPVPPL